MIIHIMKNWIYKLGVVLLACFMLSDCTEEDPTQQAVVGKKTDVVLNFGSIRHDDVEIKTRMTYDEPHYESMVRNIYVFIFANGNKVYGRFFDDDDFDTSKNEYWSVNNMSADDTSVQTSGTIHMRVPTISGDAEVMLISNIDLDIMNLSKERLGLVQSKSDLQKMILSLNQEITERNAGYFMMTGSKEGVTISSDGTITIPDGKIMLKRIDAKIKVNVRVNPEDGNTKQRVEVFTPESWQVMNLPKSSYLIPGTSPLQMTNDSYFNTSPAKFETTENETVDGTTTGAVLSGFSFYALENMRSGEKKKETEGNYHNRDRRNKHNDESDGENYGKYDNTNGLWEYAPEYATYMIIKGELQMTVDPESTSAQQLIADVTYYVHLGDFSTDTDNYDVLRNTTYTYTINVKGVNNIEVEVETSNDENSGITEDQPGSMGDLYEAKEEIHTFDAHYGQHVYTIHAGDIDTENMTWYVRTPFGREGIPTKDASGKEIYNDLDYKWVEFMINEKVAGTNIYAATNRKYTADKTKMMSVIELIDLVKTEATAWQNGNESMFDENDEIKFTAFVNEFYYDENPMNPNDTDILWKKFVNQPNRLMHILCDNQRSKDDDSSMTGSIVTIRQRSIQTPYNISLDKTELNEAWGCETVDETKNSAWFYHPDERLENYTSYLPAYTPDNTSRTDGLYNTACLLNLVNGTGIGKTLNTSLQWDDYIDYSESEPKLKDEYNSGLYSVLLRNRDLDGDGIIDPEELRWYIASIDQLCGLFIGDQGISTDAQLYPIATSLEPNSPVSGGVFDGVYPWRLHVVSSTAWEQTAGAVPTIVWAEEGAALGKYQVHWGKQGYSPVRCIRNLGVAAASSENIITAGNNYPEDPLVIVIKQEGTISTSSVYRFNMQNMNNESKRLFYTTKEFVPSDEYSILSRVYYGFETGELGDSEYSYENYLKGELENGGSPSPESYRVPNIREAVIMYLYCGEETDWWGGKSILVSSYYSFGYYGNLYDVGVDSNNASSWLIKNNEITIGSPKGYIRFVKDWTP